MRAWWRIEVLSREQFSRVRGVECKFRDVDVSNISHSFLVNEMLKTGRSLLFLKKTQRILNNIVWLPLVQEARSSLLYYHHMIMTSKHGRARFNLQGCPPGYGSSVNLKQKGTFLRFALTRVKGTGNPTQPLPPGRCTLTLKQISLTRVWWGTEAWVRSLRSGNVFGLGFRCLHWKHQFFGFDVCFGLQF